MLHLLIPDRENCEVANVSLAVFDIASLDVP
jgi:hypothetical protein